jgi:hypothetical protein
MGGGGTTVQTPPPPKYGESMEEILRAQLKYAPQIYEAEKKYQPLYQALQSQQERQAAEAQIKLYADLQPAFSDLEAAYQKRQQEDQLKALQERGQGYVQAFQEAAGTGRITKGLGAYAEELQARQPQYEISPEEQRALEQQTRAAYAARGTALGDQASLTEVLNRYQFQRQRRLEEDQLQAQRQQMAAGIAGVLQQQSAPAMQSFYQQPMYAGNFAGNVVQSALLGQQQAGPQNFNPESQVGMGSIYGAYNAQTQAAIGQAQANAAAGAGRMGMFGSLGGGVLGLAGKFIG